MAVFPDRSITITVSGDATGYQYWQASGPIQTSPTFPKDVNGNSWQSGVAYLFFAIHPELAPDPRLIRVYFTEDGIQSIIREETALPAGSDDLDDTSLRTDLTTEAVLPDGVMMSVLTSVGYILRRFTPESFRLWLNIDLSRLTGYVTSSPISTGGYIRNTEPVSLDNPDYIPAWFRSGTDWALEKITMVRLRIQLGIGLHNLLGYVTGNAIKTGGYGRDYFIPLTKPEGLAVISKNGPLDSYIEMMYAGDARTWMEVTRSILGGAPAGYQAVLRYASDGTPELIYVPRDTLNDVALRNPNTITPIVTRGYGRSSAPVELGYPSSIACWTEPDVFGTRYLEYVGLAKLLNEGFGLIPAQVIYDRIKQLIPGVSTAGRGYIVEEIRCFDETYDDGTPAAITEQTIILTGVADGQVISHSLGSVNLNQIIYDQNGRININAFVKPASPTTVTFNNPGVSEGFTGELYLTIKKS